MGAIAKFEQKQKVLQDFFSKSTCLELQCIFIAVETSNMNLAYKCAWFLAKWAIQIQQNYQKNCTSIQNVN